MVPSGLAMVIFAPVSGRMINRYGGRITLITGAAVMGVSYIGRVYYSSTVLAMIIGSTVVGIGTAIAYAAMPTLIMASVPITETASAQRPQRPAAGDRYVDPPAPRSPPCSDR